MFLWFRFAGGHIDSIPHPDADWGEFINVVQELNNKEPKVFCTLANQFRPWIDIAKLNKIYGGKNGSLASSSSSSSCVVS